MKSTMVKRALFVLSVGLCAVVVADGKCCAATKFELGSPFSSGMVLQRGMPVNVWGFAAPLSEVSVSFGGALASGTADSNGRWRVKLPTMEADATPRKLVATCGDNRISVDDVLVGEVWLASGQSNMECPLVGKTTRFRDRQGALVAQMTHKPQVRYFFAAPFYGSIYNEVNLPLGPFEASCGAL